MVSVVGVLWLSWLTLRALKALAGERLCLFPGSFGNIKNKSQEIWIMGKYNFMHIIYGSGVGRGPGGALGARAPLCHQP